MLKFECKDLGINGSYITSGNIVEDVKKNE